MSLKYKWISGLFLPCLLLWGWSTGARAGDTPLLMEGKKTLFQRVIVHPGLKAYESPTGRALSDIRPFTVLYVYERRKQAAVEWLKVGPTTNGQNLFWAPQKGLSEWKQALVLTFSQRAGRAPLLFFKSLADLEKTAGQPNVMAALARLENEFHQYAQGRVTPPDSFAVVGLEPSDAQGAVPYDRFYLMPVFSYAEPFEGAKFLEVASIDPGQAAGPSPKPARGDGGESGEADGSPETSHVPPPQKDLKSGLAFVIDTTISMRPYIEESLNVTRGIYDQITKNGLQDQMGLAVVAFRSNVEASPGLEYTSKVISPLRLAQNRADFEKALSETREARVSTHSFNEDALAGIKTAVEDLDWSPYQSRIILLITDAGPLDNSDPYSSTKMNSREMADLAKQKNIKIITLHVKTPGGKHNHAYAAQAYQELSPLAEGETGYLALEAANGQQGAKQFAWATRVLADKVGQAVAGAPKGTVKKPGAKPTPPSAPLAERTEALGEALGYSIQLEYLGRANNSTAPQVVRSWISDHDLARLAGSTSRATATVEVAVLLSKDQLSALRQRLEIIIDNAERSRRTDSRDFFTGIMEASAQLSRDPAQFAASPGRSLGEMGLLGEFVDGLPYQSDILAMTEEDWYKMSVGQQTQFINRLKSRLIRYEEYYKDVDNWESFGSPYPGDHLYRVPLSMLP